MKQLTILLSAALAAASAQASSDYNCVGFGQSIGQSLTIRHLQPPGDKKADEKTDAKVEVTLSTAGANPATTLSGAYQVPGDDFFSTVTFYELSDVTGEKASLEVVEYLNIGRGGCGRGGCANKTEISAQLNYLGKALTYACQKVVP